MSDKEQELSRRRSEAIDACQAVLLSMTKKQMFDLHDVLIQVGTKNGSLGELDQLSQRVVATFALLGMGEAMTRLRNTLGAERN